MSAREHERDSKLLGLELIRFACSFAVLLCHYRHFYRVEGGSPLVMAEQPWFELLRPLYIYGQYGVQLFWGISGFIFFWKYGAAISEGVVRAGNFFWLRFSRLYPLHLATLLLVAALQPFHSALTGAPFINTDVRASQFLLQLGMATQWAGPASYSFNGPVWSVSAEVLVYALFFALATKARDRARLCLLMVIGSMGVIMAGLSNWPVVLCSAYFFAGGLAAEWSLRGGRQGGVRRSLLALAALGVFAWWQSERFVALAPVLLLAVIVPLLYLGAYDWSPLKRWTRPIQAAGNLTYATYLCHFPLQLILAIAVAAGGFALPVSSPLFLIAYLAVTMVVGRWVFVKFELPAQNWLRSLTLRRSPQPA